MEATVRVTVRVTWKVNQCFIHGASLKLSKSFCCMSLSWHQTVWNRTKPTINKQPKKVLLGNKQKSLNSWGTFVSFLHNDSRWTETASKCPAMAWEKTGTNFSSPNGDWQRRYARESHSGPLDDLKMPQQRWLLTIGQASEQQHR